MKLNSASTKIHQLLIVFFLLIISSCSDDTNTFGACETKISDPDFGTQYTCREGLQKSLCNSKGITESFFYEGSPCSSLGYIHESQDGSGQYYASSTNYTTAGSGGAWAGSGGNSGGVDSYDYTFTCAWDGSENTVPIPKDGCESENEYYARTFICNEVANMYDACRDYFGCNNETDISFCDQYK
ncbi:MAG: hypothetical protein ABJN36_03440 [Cyclobacteriaceae bacterium]